MFRNCRQTHAFPILKDLRHTYRIRSQIDRRPPKGSYAAANANDGIATDCLACCVSPVINEGDRVPRCAGYRGRKRQSPPSPVFNDLWISRSASRFCIFSRFSYFRVFLQSAKVSLMKSPLLYSFIGTKVKRSDWNFPVMCFSSCLVIRIFLVLSGR